MPSFDLVIFDCDGVLVDSEPVANEVLAEVLASYEIAISAPDARTLFAGLSVDDVRLLVDDRFGILMPQDWSADYYARLIPALGEQVTAVEGVGEVLAQLTGAGIRFCVASQGPIAKMQATLSRAGFRGLFDGHLYSAKHVGKPKPAPDLFLHAATSEGICPACCAVVEDSPVGIAAARAAGMTVFSYCSQEMASDMAKLGAISFSSMAELPTLLGLSGEKTRHRILQEIALRVAAIDHCRPVRVAVDGRTASGKTTFADELAAVLARSGRPVIRTSIDGFHRPKAERYARGRNSPEGYYYDARDLPAVRRLLLDPLGPDGSRLYQTASFDLQNDQPINAPAILAPQNAVLVVDGTFLQRDELVEGWDVIIYLDVSETVSTRRGIERDATLLGGADVAAGLYAMRYSPAEHIYRLAVQPELNADAIVDNEDFDNPKLSFRQSGRLAHAPKSRL